MDRSCATITAPQEAMTSLISHLENKSGFVAKIIDLQGRFHHESHQASLEQLLQLCAALPMLQFPQDCPLLVPLRKNDDGQSMAQKENVGNDHTRLPVHEVVLQCILVKKADWYATITMSAAAVAQRQASMGKERPPRALLVGPVDCMPHSVPFQTERPWASRARHQQVYTYPDHAIAIVGASGRFPGSESLDGFWNMIKTKQSTAGVVPECRGYGKSDSGQGQVFRGNYLDQEGSFDHAFFRKSPREASYMDPQHRLALLLAHEALESSGYFSPSSSKTKAPVDVGCYVGISSDDYRDNVHAHPPTAFSFTGTARAFAPGHISHFFGWDGPSLAIDTACSSSMVAIHTAVQGIQSGDCSMALAGGLNVMTSPRSHQNLAGASFLSPSGQCRPFDAGANGYCRGEGAGFVVLKKLSAAVADHDHILGVLVGSATNNSKGNASITVPSSDSQTELYRRVLRMAGMQPDQVSYVEAHGTGTQKGDPIECRSIRHVFGNAGRRLRFGSVKGNIGHCESASGVASLLKVLLMLQHGMIPPQANLSVVNPALGSLEEDDMEIPQHLQPWNVPFRAACVNNYGASGSNAAILVCQPPGPELCDIQSVAPAPVGAPPPYPFLISAHSEAALYRYFRALLGFIEAHETQHDKSGSDNSREAFLSAIAFHLAQKQNHTLRYRATFQVKSLHELKIRLRDESGGEKNPLVPSNKIPLKPIVLVFAGQTGHRPRLSPEAYHGSRLLQRHLDRCDRMLQSLGLRSLFPYIFGDEAIDDLVDLHCMQFSVQFAAAMAWIDAGLEIKKLVGHSLGQLTALCVSGAVSLRDGFKLVSGRAALIQTKWGPERGCMLSVDADIATVHKLLGSLPEDPEPSSDSGSESSTSVEIACYNSASSHIVVGSEAAIARVEDTARCNQIRSKRLAVTHGFHSHLVESIMEEFSELVRGIQFSTPRIPLEPCARMPVSWDQLTPEVVARQSREPVYFSHTISRLEKQLGPSCIWLEAGSGAIGVTMVRRALEATPGSAASHSGHSFISSRLHTPGAIDSLAAATLSLWRQGIRVQFWPFHAMQRDSFGTIELPPYQFETSRHWLPTVEPVSHRASRDRQATTKDKYKHLRPSSDTGSQMVSFQGFQHEGSGDEPTLTAAFSINQHTNEYSALVLGRKVLDHDLVPASVWIESAIRALLLLLPPSASHTATASVQVESTRLHAPFVRDLSKRLRLTLREQKPGSMGFDFVVEYPCETTSADHSTLTLLASGSVRLRESTQPGPSGLGPHERMLERLIDYDQCVGLVQSPNVSLVQGTFVRKLLSQLVSFTPESFRIQSIAMKDVEAVAQVMLSPVVRSASISQPATGMHPLIFDNSLLVAEMHANNQEDCPTNQVYICHGLDAVIPRSSSMGPWTVYSKLHRCSGDAGLVINDIFVFNSCNKTLELVILGAKFSRVLLGSFEQTLNKMDMTEHKIPKTLSTRKARPGPCHLDSSFGGLDLDHRTARGAQLSCTSMRSLTTAQGIPTPPSSIEENNNPLADTLPTVIGLIREITAGIGDLQIDRATCLSDMGVDSLSATELQARIQEVLGCNIALRKYLDGSLTLGDLCKEIHGNPGLSEVATAHNSPDVRPASTVVDDSSLYQQPLSSAQVVSKNDEASRTEARISSQLLSLLEEYLNMPVESPPDHLTPLGDMGLDSLVAIQLQSSIHELFGKETHLSPDTTFAELCNSIFPGTSVPPSATIATSLSSRGWMLGDAHTSVHNVARGPRMQSAFFSQAPAELCAINDTYATLTQETGWAGFFSGAHQKQQFLVLAYILEAFSVLGCDIANLPAGSQLPAISYLPKYEKLVARLHEILQEAGLIEPSDGLGLRRTAKPTPGRIRVAAEMHDEILRELPEYSPEHQLLHVMAPHLADCLSGNKDPLELLFRDRVAKQLLTDVYVKSPLFATGNMLLGQFLSRIIPHHQRSEPSRRLQVLEIGGGTGGTTHLVLQKLIECAADFAYTFTDISSGLVTATRRAFISQYGQVAQRMEWSVLNIEEAPPADAYQRYDLVISANCIHATRNLDVSCANIRRLLRPEGGMLCLLELTRKQAWLDCVFGLLDGWWRFEDGRTHALAGERQWEGILRKAGFLRVDWSDDESRESDQLRLITGLSRGDV